MAVAPTEAAVAAMRAVPEAVVTVAAPLVEAVAAPTVEAL